MHLLLQAIRFVTSRIVLKIFLFLTVGMLFAAINLVNPNDLDPFGLAAPLGIDISEAQYDAGDKAALGAILTAILLANALFLKRKDGEGPEAVELVDWLLGFETLSIAITVGWNWLLWETQSSPGPQLLAVLSGGPAAGSAHFICSSSGGPLDRCPCLDSRAVAVVTRPDETEVDLT